MGKRRIPAPHWSNRDLHAGNPFAKCSPTILENYRVELEMMLRANQREAVRWNTLLSMVNEAVRLVDGPDRVVLTDHAIVRYLERYEGFDVARIEDAISGMLDEGRPEIAVRDGVVVTVLPEGCTAETRP